MTAELTYLTWITTLTAIMWIPYILNMIMVRGLLDAVGYPQDPAPLSSWAARLKAAHMNSVENLVVFAVLVLIANAAGVSNEATGMASQIFFWARVIHFLSYTARVPWVRTITFVVGFVCQLTFAWQILA